MFFSIYWEFHHPNWRFVIFFRGVGGWNHQPDFVRRFPASHVRVPVKPGWQWGWDDGNFWPHWRKKHRFKHKEQKSPQLNGLYGSTSNLHTSLSDNHAVFQCFSSRICSCKASTGNEVEDVAEAITQSESCRKNPVAAVADTPVDDKRNFTKVYVGISIQKWSNTGWWFGKTMEKLEIIAINFITGWWFGTWIFWLPRLLGNSSSQLTIRHIFQRGRLKPPTRTSGD